MNMETSIQRTFKKIHLGVYQEYFVYLINTIDALGNKISKFDRTVPGGIYRVAISNDEGSWLGETLYLDPEDGIEKRLLKIRDQNQSI